MNLIFDFDGTLADSLPLAINLFNKLSVTGKKLDKSAIQHLRNLPARQVLKIVGIPFWRLPRLLTQGRQEITKHIDEIPVFNDMPKTLSALDTKEYRLFVMSSNSTQNVKRFLKNNHIEKHFRAVYGNVGVFGKASVLKRIMKINNLSKNDTFYIGDEVRDVEAAHRAGIRSIAVTWGYNDGKILKVYEPDFQVDSPAALLQTIQKQKSV